MNIRPFLIVLLLPAALTALLLYLRRKYPLHVFACVALESALIAVGLWACGPTVTLHYSGPLNASGFDSWAFVPAFVSIVLVCAIPPFVVWRFFQPFIAVLSALYWFDKYMRLA
jgi:hypothetical protein